MKKIPFSIKPLAALLLVVFLLCSCSSKVSDDINLEPNQGKNLKEAISNTLQADVVPGENLPPSISYSNEVYKSISFSILSKDDKTGVASVEFTYVDVLSLADEYSGPSKNLDLFYAHCIQEIASGNAKTITETVEVSYSVLTEGSPKIYTIDHIENIANILTGGSIGYIDDGTMGPVDTKEGLDKSSNTAIGTWHFKPDSDEDVYLTLNHDGTATFESIYSDGNTDTETCKYILADSIRDLQDEGYDEFYCYYISTDDSLVVRLDGYTVEMERATKYNTDGTTKPVTPQVDLSQITITVPLYGTSLSKIEDGKFTANVAKGESFWLEVQGTDVKPAWSVADRSIATASSDGTIKGVQPGETIVTANLNGTIVEIVVYVKDNPVEGNCAEHDWIASSFEEKTGAVTKYTCSSCKTVGTVVDSVFATPTNAHIDQLKNKQGYVYYYR